MLRPITLILLITFFFISCSHLDWTENEHLLRIPSNINVTVDDALSFKKESSPRSKNTKDALNQIMVAQAKDFNPVFIEKKDLPPDVAFKLELDVVNGNYQIRILHSPDAFYYHQAAVGIAGFLQHFNKYSGIMPTSFNLFEIYYNAKEKDVESINTLLKLRQSFVSAGSDNFFDIPAQDLMLESKQEAQMMQEILAPSLKLAAKERKLKKIERKKIIDVLDKASDDQQLKSMIARNDRIGVSNLLRQYLPFEDMAPFEKRYWETYLDIIKNPVPLEERIFIYRGINDDFLHIAKNQGAELDREAAIKEGKIFLMSTILVKNQGSWNRRLRSLESMEEKFIATHNESTEFTDRSRITTMFKKHSGQAQGSPFLSFTPNINIANSFGSSKNSAYLIDPRLLQFNFTSGYTNEVEFLTGLMTFPDEMVGIWTLENNSKTPTEQYFKQKLENLIESKFGMNEKDKVLKEIEKNTYDFFSPVYRNNKAINDETKKSGYLGTMSDFFKKFLGTKKEPLPAINSSGDLNCVDVIKLFWVNP